VTGEAKLCAEAWKYLALAALREAGGIAAIGLGLARGQLLGAGAVAVLAVYAALGRIFELTLS